jgi:hypothetical protein
MLLKSLDKDIQIMERRIKEGKRELALMNKRLAQHSKSRAKLGY